jgi:hypothetical protein
MGALMTLDDLVVELATVTAERDRLQRDFDALLKRVENDRYLYKENRRNAAARLRDLAEELTDWRKWPL